MVEHILGRRYAGLCDLEGGRILAKIALKSAHLPTLLLMVGYPVFWLELYVIHRGEGKTSFLALFLFLICSLFYLRRKEEMASPFLEKRDESAPIHFSKKLLIGLGAFVSLYILLCVFYASLYPPHLVQEWDAIHYHITLPRQHLLTGSFKPIPWAADDFFLLPVQFGLAPFWLATTLPNKFPQFIFVLGIIFTSVNLINHLRINKSLSFFIVIFAILGSHHIGIQMGTAMLDLVVCYLFLAALDSFLRGNIFLAAVEFTFFFWSKPAMPLQVTVIMLLTCLIVVILKKMGFRLKLGFSQYVDAASKARYGLFFRKVFLGFILLSLCVGGPFVAKSIYYAGTPLFPFGVGMISVNKNIDHDSRSWKSLVQASQVWTSEEEKNKYGYAHRNAVNFIKHLWLIAVPEKGVNNRFDYPVGLPYLIFLAPFLYMCVRDLKKKELGILPLFVCVCWLMWWVAIQQTRHLYIPTTLIFITVIPEIKDYSKIFLSILLLALMLNALSIFRVHKKDFGLSRTAVLRQKDLGIIRMNKEYIEHKKEGEIDLEFHDVAFAQFPVRVTKEQLPHTIAF